MGKFKAGDRVVSGRGDVATVRQSSELLTVQWDENSCLGNWPATLFELVKRKFKSGDYVRVVADDNTNGMVGLVFEDDGSAEDEDPYWVALFDVEQSEEPYSADELIPWVPVVGERVIEANNEPEEDDEGTVIEVNGNDVRVLWDAFPLVQGGWTITDLEPVDEYGKFQPGDVVEYESPFIIGSYKATVKGVDGNVIRVAFHSGPLLDGAYSKELFSKAA